MKKAARKFQFTFEKLEEYYAEGVEIGYKFITCSEYFRNKSSLTDLCVVNRVDIDLSVKKAERLCDIFDKLKIKASFFVRLHAPEYNPFSFENFRILKKIKDSGHEIGYHSEVVDQAAIWNEDPEACLRRDIKILNTMLDTDIRGVASHGGMTGLNNLDFWAHKNADSFGLWYEAYDDSDVFGLFNKSLYISDSEWTRWKCYDAGKLRNEDHRNPKEHFQEKHALVYLLIHPDTYYDRHIYE